LTGEDLPIGLYTVSVEEELTVNYTPEQGAATLAEDNNVANSSSFGRFKTCSFWSGQDSTHSTYPRSTEHQEKI
jgi:hypothetical protein